MKIISILAVFGIFTFLPLSHRISAATIPISDLPVGKVIQIGSKSFVKVRQDLSKGAQFLALTPVSYQQTFNYTGSVQTWTVPYSGTYQIELWGAQSGEIAEYTRVNQNGSYVAGDISLTAGNLLYFYVGSQPPDTVYTSNYGAVGGYNGGAKAADSNWIGDGNCMGAAGGGATDVRLVGGAWNDVTGLRSRLLVAAGAGGESGGAPGYAGGLIGGNGSVYQIVAAGVGASQIAGGSTSTDGAAGDFGFANTAPTRVNPGGGGGGGYYGGGSAVSGSTSRGCGGGGGGSSFISGHTGCVAITSATDQTPKSGCTTGTSDYNCSLHYSGMIFTNTVMIDGQGYAWTNVKGSQIQMPNPAGGNYALGVGHTGNGVARITLI